MERMAVIDLSMTIQPMWRWQCEITFKGDFSAGDPYRLTHLKTGMHAFTHVDTPLHIEAGRESIDCVSLGRLCGAAAVLDLGPVVPNQGSIAESMGRIGGSSGNSWLNRWE
jgi:kynurenine formamidase